MQALEVILRQNAEAAADAEVAKLLAIVPILPEDFRNNTSIFVGVDVGRVPVVAIDFVRGDKL